MTSYLKATTDDAMWRRDNPVIPRQSRRFRSHSGNEEPKKWSRGKNDLQKEQNGHAKNGIDLKIGRGAKKQRSPFNDTRRGQSWPKLAQEGEKRREAMKETEGID